MSKYKKKLFKIINQKNIISDKSVLSSFSRDKSLEKGTIPDYIVSPTTEDEIIRLLELANELNIPIVATSSNIGYYGETIPKKGGIILDLRKMDTIIEINSQDRYVWIEPGVTYEKLVPELKKHGLRISLPIGYSSSSSVLSTYIERAPLLTGPKML
ncbi:MAG: FAD-binding oxidoreductase, partial [Promethearchaeota archaeon]